MTLVDAVLIISFILDAFGAAIVLFGAFMAAFTLIRIETKKGNTFKRYDEAKKMFVQRLVFGLDFFITGDIIQTLILPAPSQLTTLAVIVGIRTVLSFFLSREVRSKR